MPGTNVYLDHISCTQVTVAAVELLFKESCSATRTGAVVTLRQHLVRVRVGVGVRVKVRVRIGVRVRDN